MKRMHLKSEFDRIIATRTRFAWLTLIAVLTVTPAWANWSGFTSTGTATAIGNPSCAQAGNDHVACAVLGEKSAMMVNQYNGTTWGTWTALTGAVASGPTCTSDGDGKVFCAATEAGGGLEVAVLTGTTWGTPATVAGSLYSAPSCAEYLAGQVLCVARNAAGGLAWTLYSGGKWSAFANITTVAVSTPSCTSDHDTGVICSFYTVGGTTVVDRFAGGSWKGLINIGGQGGGTTNCTFWKPNGEVACFAKATNDGVYVSTFNGGTWTAGNWTAYSGLGGTLNDNASCTTQALDQLVCGAVGLVGNNEFYGNSYDGTTWSGWIAAPGAEFLGSPSCTPLTTGKVVCVSTGTNNELKSVVGP